MWVINELKKYKIATHLFIELKNQNGKPKERAHDQSLITSSLESTTPLLLSQSNPSRNLFSNQTIQKTLKTLLSPPSTVP